MTRATSEKAALATPGRWRCLACSVLPLRRLACSVCRLAPCSPAAREGSHRGPPMSTRVAVTVPDDVVPTTATCSPTVTLANFAELADGSL
jgi:hypothetical protein